MNFSITHLKILNPKSNLESEFLLELDKIYWDFRHEMYTAVLERLIDTRVKILRYKYTMDGLLDICMNYPIQALYNKFRRY